MADMTESEARTSVERTKRGLEAAASEVVRQIAGRAWIALGYESWDEMRLAEYSGAAVIVPRTDRPQLSARLSAEGLSQQQIADTLGVGQKTISRDVSQMTNAESDAPPTRTDSLGREQPRSKPRAASPQPEPAPPPEPEQPEEREPEPDEQAERLDRLRQMADEAEHANPYIPIRELVDVRDALRRAIPKMRTLKNAGQSVGADALTAGIVNLYKELEELL